MKCLILENRDHLTTPMQSIDIQGFSYEEQSRLLPQLVTAIDQCGGWLLERKSLSSTTLELQMEIQLESLIELYAELIASGSNSLATATSAWLPFAQGVTTQKILLSVDKCSLYAWR